MDRDLLRSVALVAAVGYIALYLGRGLVGMGVWPWVGIALLATGIATGVLRWGETVREWWAAAGASFRFGVVVAAALSLNLFVPAAIWLPWFWELYSVLAIGILAGYLLAVLVRWRQPGTASPIGNG